jgi:hypothetical protein
MTLALMERKDRHPRCRCLPKEHIMRAFIPDRTRFSGSARHEALFASDLQPTDAPTAGMVAEAIERTVRRFGVRGCAGRMAQEFGDHPDAAATRMRWVRNLAWAAASPGA